MGGMVDLQPRRVLLDRERPQAFRKTRAADAIASAAQPPGRVQRTSAHARSVADFHGPAGAHPAAQTSEQRIFARGRGRLASASRGHRGSNAEAAEHGSEVELMREFANPMPVRIILEMLGIPQELRDTFVDWSRAIAAFRGNPNRTVDEARAAQDALIALTEFFRKTVAERRRNKGNDLISLLIDIEEEGEVLTEEELYAQCIALLFAGHETTRNLIGNGMYTLLQNPQETAELREKPEMIRSAVEELLRYESPVQFTARVLKEEIEVCGQQIPKGWTVLCMLGAANRDPKQFKEPNQLNLKRLNNQHLAFSAGPHVCIGAQLARLEGQVAILNLVQRFPKMKLTGPRPEWASTFGLRGLKSLPVVL